ncbi:hypothetical protein [Endozoicomonas sp. 4G]|uniref:hypothetical protein n=1 Tax=Endozoicomonas sp. 4G TaxID=2872754 RepID=UPI002078ADE9|nr:hypothetical protein [Endozoicomonas sp. 4G]
MNELMDLFKKYDSVCNPPLLGVAGIHYENVDAVKELRETILKNPHPEGVRIAIELMKWAIRCMEEKHYV